VFNRSYRDKRVGVFVRFRCAAVNTNVFWYYMDLFQTKNKLVKKVIVIQKFRQARIDLTKGFIVLAAQTHRLNKR
jgi:hypothetical protein